LGEMGLNIYSEMAYYESTQKFLTSLVTIQTSLLYSNLFRFEKHIGLCNRIPVIVTICGIISGSDIIAFGL